MVSFKKGIINIYIYNKHGLTIVELLVTLFLLILVLTMSLSFYLFSTNSFTKGTSRADVQQNVRLASELITREIRYANSLEIIDNSSFTPDIGYNYLYTNDGNLIHINAEGVVTKLFGEISSMVYFTLKLERSTNGNHILNFNIEGKDNENIFDIGSEVLMLNLKEIEDHSTGYGTAIKYSKIASAKIIVLNPEYHVTGSGQSIEVIVETSNIPDGASVIAEFCEVDKTSFGPQILDNDTVINNRAILELNVDSLNSEAGYYKVKVTVSGIPEPVYKSYVIGKPIIDLVKIEPSSHLAGNEQQITVNIVTRYVTEGTPCEVSFIQIDGTGEDDISNNGIINDNSAELFLNINDNKPIGNYEVKVTAQNIEPYIINYEIKNPSWSG